ncbi:ATP-dependent RNA helicase [Coemansia sp. RSA 552]|nr:ATP-dependent RNA helicase [Coemansia sp. RSA 552]
MTTARASSASENGRGSSKRQRKARQGSAEETWADLTLNPPPMPAAAGIPSLNKGNAPAKKAKGALKRAKPSNPRTELAWKDVAMPVRMGGADNGMGGVLSLQEIDGVDCVWEDEAGSLGGKILKFSESKTGKKRGKNGRAAKAPSAPAAPALGPGSEDEVEDFESTVNWDDFVMLDEFSEEKAQKGELISIGAHIRNSAADDSSASGASDSDQSDMDDPAEEAVSAQSSSEDEIEDPDVDVSAWARLDVQPVLLRALKHLGFTKPTEIQSKTLPSALSGRDIIGAAETGSGKTLAFGIPMLQHVSKSDTTGLVLTPTRELAIQVKNHLVAMSKFNGANIVVVVGGMSQAKQERVLKSNPDIIVATPGRLWELVSTNDAYLQQLKGIRFLVVDEADRMLEPGHFKELRFIFKALNEAGGPKRQTFVFSATLLKDMQLVARKMSQKALKRRKGRPEPGSMEDLIERVGFQDKEPLFVDVTQPDATAKTLVETRIDCLSNEKDYYLYYFLVRYPARTLVFVNSIDSIRRMLPMLRLLKVSVFGLHAQMEQRQRLKSIDWFRATENAVLVASDVAARGLDIPQVEYVIHYQLPRSGDLYVHRSGRTARASQEGLAVMMVSPEERKLYYKMCAKLYKDIASFPVDLDLIGRLKPRVDLARDIELREHKLNKATHERNWFKKNAEELDIELDSDFMPSSDDERGAEAGRSDQQEKRLVKSLKTRLSQLLAKKVLGRGISERYLSGGVLSDLAERLTNPSIANAVIPTLRKESALETAKARRDKRQKV